MENKNKHKQEGNKEPRRDFLSKVLGVWALLGLVPVVNVVIRFLTPAKAASLSESIQVDSIAEISRNSAKIVRFGKEPVIVIHTSGGQFKAFFARCTHLGCVVKFEGDGDPHFHCNCHGSNFDLTGKNLTGPAPRPLTPLKVVVKETSLIVSRISEGA